MEKLFQLTRSEKIELEQKKEYIQNVLKPEVEAELTLARSQGDLSENADYDAALEKNQAIHNELNTILYQLDNSYIYQHVDNIDTVQFGDTVTFTNSLNKKSFTWTIGGLSDLPNGKMDYKSPVAKALLGHKVGDVVLIKAAKPYKATITNIEYKE